MYRSVFVTTRKRDEVATNILIMYNRTLVVAATTAATSVTTADIHPPPHVS